MPPLPAAWLSIHDYTTTKNVTAKSDSSLKFFTPGINCPANGFRVSVDHAFVESTLKLQDLFLALSVTIICCLEFCWVSSVFWKIKLWVSKNSFAGQSLLFSLTASFSASQPHIFTGWSSLPSGETLLHHLFLVFV